VDLARLWWELVVRRDHLRAQTVAVRAGTPKPRAQSGE
jgi:hypothetical protein